MQIQLLRRLHIFDEEKKKYSWIDKAKKIRFVSPIGVTTDGEDNIYVSDSELRKVFKLNKDGKFHISHIRRLCKTYRSRN